MEGLQGDLREALERLYDATVAANQLPPQYHAQIAEARMHAARALRFAATRVEIPLGEHTCDKPTCPRTGETAYLAIQLDHETIERMRAQAAKNRSGGSHLGRGAFEVVVREAPTRKEEAHGSGSIDTADHRAADAPERGVFG